MPHPLYMRRNTGGLSNLGDSDSIDPNSITYYSNLVAQSFDPSVAYGISEAVYQSALSDLFANGLTPIWDKINYGLLFRGTSNAQKLIDIKETVTPTIGSQPTIAAKYYDFDGSANHITIGTNMNALNGADETDFSFVDLSPSYVSGINATYGVVNAPDERSAIYYNGYSVQYLAHSSSSYAEQITGTFDQATYGGIQNEVTTKLYKNGVNVGTFAGVQGINGTLNEYIGAANGGGAIWFYKGKIGCIIRGIGTISEAEFQALDTAWSNFKTATNSNW